MLLQAWDHPEHLLSESCVGLGSKFHSFYRILESQPDALFPKKARGHVKKVPIECRQCSKIHGLVASFGHAAISGGTAEIPTTPSTSSAGATSTAS